MPSAGGTDDVVYRQLEADYSRSSFSEELVEDAAISGFRDLGYADATAGEIAPGGTKPERAAPAG